MGRRGRARERILIAPEFHEPNAFQAAAGAAADVRAGFAKEERKGQSSSTRGGRRVSRSQERGKAEETGVARSSPDTVEGEKKAVEVGGRPL